MITLITLAWLPQLVRSSALDKLLARAGWLLLHRHSVAIPSLRYFSDIGQAVSSHKLKAKSLKTKNLPGKVFADEV